MMDEMMMNNEANVEFEASENTEVAGCNNENETAESKKNGLAVAGGIIAGAGAAVATVIGSVQLVKHFKKVAELKKNGTFDSVVEAKKKAKANRKILNKMTDEELNRLMALKELKDQIVDEAVKNAANEDIVKEDIVKEDIVEENNEDIIEENVE